MTKVKICGVTNLEDAMMAIDAGADMLGFNFYKPSSRYLVPTDAKVIIESLPPNIVTVGVFVNSSVEDVEDIYSDLSLDYVQLHGDETADFVSQLKTRTGAKVIKVIRVNQNFDEGAASFFNADHFLLDSDSESYGGSGEKFDWDAAIRFKEAISDLYLAGGLTPENVADAIRKVQPFAVDVCSGVESAKGIKDPVKVNAFVRNAKGAL